MKKPYLFFLFAAIAFGCGDKSKYLLTRIPREPVINPETKVLIKNDTITYVRLDTGNIIRGFTANNFFTTTTNFTDFQYSGYKIPATAISPFHLDNKVFVMASGSAASPVITYSEDYGKTWSSVTAVLNPAINTSGYYANQLIWVNYMDKQNITLLYHQKSYYNGDVRSIYRVDATTGQGKLMAGYSDANQPLSAQFVDAKTGWMLLFRGTEGNTYITKTLDSGKNWSKLVLVDSKKLTTLQTSDKGTLMVYEPYGSAAFSTDSGATWKKPASEFKFSRIQMLNPAVSMALTTSGLMKSVDSGSTWATISTNGNYDFSDIRKIHFQDDKNGVMYTTQKLYITADGGANWKTLLYPYPYILE